MLQHQNYTREIVAGQEEALSKIVEKIPFRSVVLDIGCGTGMMGRFLSENRECVVDGVDIDAEAVAIAKPKYRKVGVFNLEHDTLLGAFSAEAYDCIVMADVIEHLVHPEQLFEDVKKLLKPNGQFLFSIPNITHISAGLELVLGKFGYQNSGLLDSTHVRFYSRDSFIKKLESSGIYVDELDTVKRDVDETEFSGHLSFPKHWIRDLTQDREDALTYQWIMSARLYKSAEQKRISKPIPALAAKYLSLNSRMYWSSSLDPGLSEGHSIAGYATRDAAGDHFLNFDFTAENCRFPVTGLRIDLVSDESTVVFYDAELISSGRKAFWTAQEMLQSEVCNADVIPGAAGLGTVLCPLNNDPQWMPSIDADVLRAIEVGCSLRVKVDLSEEGAVKSTLSALRDKSKRLASKLNEIDALVLARLKVEADFQAQTNRLETAEQEVSRKVAESQVLQTSARSTEAALAVKSAEVLALQAELSNLTEQMRELDVVKARYVERLQIEELSHQRTIQTISWRVTAPLRWVRSIF